MALVMPCPVNDLAFNVWSGDEEGAENDWFEMGWGGSLPRCSIEAAPASALRIVVPSLVAVGSAFTVKLAVTDVFDSAAFCPTRVRSTWKVTAWSAYPTGSCCPLPTPAPKQSAE